MELLKLIWGKWGWIVTLIFVGLFTYKMLVPPEITTVEKTVIDAEWQKSMTKKVDSVKTELTTQMSGMRKELELYREMAKDIKTVQSTVERYDPNTGKLIEKILNVVSEDKSKSSTTTTSTIDATSTASTNATTASAEATNSADEGKSKEVDSKTTIQNPQPIVSIMGGVGFKTLDGFKPTDADVGANVNLFGLKVTAIESYDFTGEQSEVKDRFKTHLMITVLELK